MNFEMPISASELKDQMINMINYRYPNLTTAQSPIVFGGDKFWAIGNKTCYYPIEVDGVIEIRKMNDRLYIISPEHNEKVYYIKDNQWFDKSGTLVSSDHFKFLEKLFDEILQKDPEAGQESAK